MPDLIQVQKHKDLIYDIGMHKGEDAEFYLLKGFRVVAIEADPDLVESCKDRLEKFITTEQLEIIEGAIVDFEKLEGNQNKISFYKNITNSLCGELFHLIGQSVTLAMEH